MDNYYLRLKRLNELYPELAPAMLSQNQDDLDDLFIEINMNLNEMKKLIRKYTNNELIYSISDEDRERRRINMLKNRKKKED